MKITFTVLLLISCTLFLGIAQSTDWRDESIRQYKKADAELDRVFQSLVTEIKEKHASDPSLNEWIEQFTRAQEAWKKFREEDQEAAAFYWRGGGTGRAQMEWATRLTLQRIKDLEKRYDPR
jgi:uncharacterized protein YecT (DUF1311 family)